MLFCFGLFFSVILSLLCRLKKLRLLLARSVPRKSVFSSYHCVVHLDTVICELPLGLDSLVSGTVSQSLSVCRSEFCPSNEIKLFLVILGRSHIHEMPSSFHPSIYLLVFHPSIHPFLSTFLFPFLPSPFSHYFFTQYSVLITAVIANSLLWSRTHAYAFSVPCCCKSLWQYCTHAHVCESAHTCVCVLASVCKLACMCVWGARRGRYGEIRIMKEVEFQNCRPTHQSVCYEAWWGNWSCAAKL